VLFGGILLVLCLMVLGSLAFAQAALTPATLPFGAHVLGVASLPETVKLKNTQSVPLTINSIVIAGGTAPGDYAWGGNCPISPNTLGAKLSCEITVTFTPSVLGSRTASLTVTDSASNSPQSVALTGTGTAPVTVSGTSLTFTGQLVGTTSAAKTITLTNHLSSALSFSSITASGDFAGSNTCGTSIGAGLKCTIGVTFAPTAIGTRTGTLTINYSAFGSPTLVALSGTGNDSGLSSITVTPTNSSIAAGNNEQLTAIGHFKTGSTENLTPFVAWSSSKASVATITPRGLATGVTAGTSTISAALGSITGTTMLTVTPPVLMSIAVTPTNPTIAKGATQQFIATGTYSDASTQNITTSVTWASSNLLAAAIAPGGLATGVGTGTSNITAC